MALLRECNIKNSDDNSVSDCVPNDVQHLVTTQHPSINKIVFASGKTSAKIFIKLNKSWLKQDNFVIQPDCGSYTSSVFSNLVKLKSEVPAANDQQIELVVPYSVSPAAASVSFVTKRNEWLSCVFSSNQH